MTLAITGATGQLGRLALAARKARGGDAVALVRDPAKAADLGVEARAFDYTKPARMAGALKGTEDYLADRDDHASRGALQDESKTLPKLIGHPTTPMAVTVREALS